MKTMLTIAALALGLFPALAEQSQHTMVNANDVQWKAAPPVLPGAQISVLHGDPDQRGHVRHAYQVSGELQNS